MRLGVLQTREELQKRDDDITRREREYEERHGQFKKTCVHGIRIRIRSVSPPNDAVCFADFYFELDAIHFWRILRIWNSRPDKNFHARYGKICISTPEVLRRKREYEERHRQFKKTFVPWDSDPDPERSDEAGKCSKLTDRVHF